MGWPPCMFPGCEAWPSSGHTGLCGDCLKHPDRVVQIANKMEKNRSRFYSKDREDMYRVAWLTREDGGALLKAVYDTMQADPSLDVRAAIDDTKARYWAQGGSLRTTSASTPKEG